jgi:hypothetical protein
MRCKDELFGMLSRSTHCDVKDKHKYYFPQVVSEIRHMGVIVYGETTRASRRRVRI